MHPFKTISILIAVMALGLMGFLNAQQKKAPAALTALDYAEIQQLYAAYNYALEIDHGDKEGDGEAFAATFTPDGIFEGRARREGHDALVKMIVDGKSRPGAGVARHFISNLLIKPTAEGAVGNAYWMAYAADADAKPPTWTYRESGIYEDWLVKTANGWRFKRRLVHFDTASGLSRGTLPPMR